MTQDKVDDRIQLKLVTPLANIESAIFIIQENLKGIHEHLKIANGRTAKNETKLEQLKGQITDLEKELPHTADKCPQNSTLQELVDFVKDTKSKKEAVDSIKQAVQKSKEEQRADFLKVINTIGVCIAAVALVINTVFSLANKKEEKEFRTNMKAQVDNINTPMINERTGKVFLYPSGLVVDSLTKADSVKYNIR